MRWPSIRAAPRRPTTPDASSTTRRGRRSSGSASTGLGIEERQIYIAYRIHLSDITDASEEEIRRNIVNLALKADEMDNMMVERFGCEFSEYSKADAR